MAIYWGNRITSNGLMAKSTKVRGVNEEKA